MTVTRETPASKQWPTEVAAMGTTPPAQRTAAADANGEEPGTNWTAGRDTEVENTEASLPPGFEKQWMRIFFGIIGLATLGIGAGWYLVPHGDRSNPVHPGLRAEAPASTPTVSAPAVSAPPAAARPAPTPPILVPPTPAPTPSTPQALVATSPDPQQAAAPAVVTAPAQAEDNRAVAQIIAEMKAPQELVVAAAHKLDQGEPYAALQLLLKGDQAGWAPASLELGRMYDPALPHRFDVPVPDLGYAIERYLRARSPSADPQTAQDARDRLDAIRAGLDRSRATNPAAAATLGKYFR